MPQETDTVLNPELKYKFVSFTELAAKKACGVTSETVRLGKLEHITNGTLVNLRETTLFQKGTRKGKTKWLDSVGKCVVTTEMEQAEKALFVETTKRCGVCQGNGLVWWGWSFDQGTKYRPCKDCH